MTDNRSELMETIDRIAQIDRELRKIGRERRKIFKRTSVIQASATLNVSNAKDDKGKRLYSNEELRRAGLTLMLDGDEEYRGFRERLEELEDQESDLAVEHNRLADCVFRW